MLQPYRRGTHSTFPRVSPTPNAGRRCLQVSMLKTPSSLSVRSSPTLVVSALVCWCCSSDPFSPAPFWLVAQPSWASRRRFVGGWLTARPGCGASRSGRGTGRHRLTATGRTGSHTPTGSQSRLPRFYGINADLCTLFLNIRVHLYTRIRLSAEFLRRSTRIPTTRRPRFRIPASWKNTLKFRPPTRGFPSTR